MNYNTACICDIYTGEIADRNVHRKNLSHLKRGDYDTEQYQEEATAGNALRDTTSKFNFYTRIMKISLQSDATLFSKFGVLSIMFDWSHREIRNS
ncbi:hypothetical protein H8356DRAFT_1326285 [Neocallimastix lanati (nom. inval.)]|nr:hypothetical protein H8356DRAFT_1326285 [Neocallimastix sp. JGI-2020a]